MSRFVSKQSLQMMLDRADPEKQQHIIGRALVALFQRQTATEQASNATDNSNGVGFTGADAKSGSLTAKFYLKHRRLEGWQIEKWTTKSKNGFARICKYDQQLDQIAAEKAIARQRSLGHM